MPLLIPTLTEEQHDFFDDLTKDATTIDDIPRIIFIFKREASRCGLLIESTIDNLSFSPRTTAPSLQRTYLKFKKIFPKWEDVYTARVNKIASVLKSAGLYMKSGRVPGVL